MPNPSELERQYQEAQDTHVVDAPPEQLVVGDRVQKIKGYTWPGVVVSVFQTLGGADRYVVECTVPEVAGALHIYNRNQLGKING